MSEQLRHQVEIIKVDEQLGIVFGFAIISKFRNENGEYEDYVDLQKDIMDDGGIVEAAYEFVKSGGAINDMHSRNESGEFERIEGSVVFQFPMTEDIMKSMNIESPFCGLMIGFKPEDDDILQKFVSGERRGFSIGGTAIEYVMEND